MVVTRKNVWSVVVGLTVMFLVLGIQQAAANPPANGCKYPGTSPNIQYRYYSVQSQQSTAHASGAGAWNSEAAPGYFSVTSGSDPEIKVYDGEYSFDGVAQAYGGCNSGGGQSWLNDLVEIKYDISKMNGYTTTGRKFIAIHELGHAYGLAHTQINGCGASYISVMHSTAVYGLNTCADSSAPYSGDVSTVNAIY